MKTQVLITGGGPTGLMMACQLQRWGIDFVIIDNKETITDKSKALAVQARSVEIFRQMGIADEAVRQGSTAKALNLIIKDRTRGHIEFGNIGEGLSPYPYILMLEQNKNEALLQDFIVQHGGKVLWQHELVNFTSLNGSINATVKDPEGQHLVIEARYLVGADGAKSPVRHMLDVPFTGGTYEHIFFVADTRVNWNMSPVEIHIALSRKTFAAFFPMGGEGRFRVVGTMPEKYTDDGSVTFADIEETVKAKMDIPISFSDTSWFSIYRVHHRVAKAFRKGSAFLAGDAAHVHSPVGAQGMNTGLQDAYNLAWKIAWVLKGISGDKLLDSYHEERHKIATTLVNSTDRMFSLINSAGPGARIFKFHLLPFFAPILMRMNRFKKMVFKLASQIAVKYTDSSLSRGAVDGSLEAGERFPYFIFTAENGKETVSHDLFNEAALFIITYNIASVNVIVPNSLPVSRCRIPVNEANQETLLQNGFGKSFICIVRPDTYIGYISEEYHGHEVQSYLKERLAVK